MANPKRLIVDYYDSLNNQIEIYFEKLLEKYDENDEIGSFSSFIQEFRNSNSYKPILKLHSPSRPFEITWDIDHLNQSKIDDTNFADHMGSITGIGPSTKVHDYLEKSRELLIGELQTAQCQHLEFYSSLRLNHDMKQLTDQKIYEIVFEKKFYFILNLNEMDAIVKKYSRNFKRKNIMLNFVLFSVDYYFDKQILYEVSALNFLRKFLIRSKTVNFFYFTFTIF